MENSCSGHVRRVWDPFWSHFLSVFHFPSSTSVQSNNKKTDVMLRIIHRITRAVALGTCDKGLVLTVKSLVVVCVLVVVVVVQTVEARVCWFRRAPMGDARHRRGQTVRP